MDLEGKKIGVFGLGVSGKAVLSFLKSYPLKSVTIVNSGNPEAWDLDSEVMKSFSKIIKCQDIEAQSELDLATCDLIILSPGIPRQHPALKKALAENIPIWNEVELAFRFFKGKIIAVTGTNGKTTTVSFLKEAFEQSGQHVFLGGNIGVPFVSALDEKGKKFDTAIIELSSFQCESLGQFKADAYLYLNLYENHGERYQEIEDYRLAKWEMVKNASSKDFMMAGPGANECPYSYLEENVNRFPDDWDEKFQKEFNLKDMQVVGAHNRFNFYGAYKICQFMGLSKDAFIKALQNFSGVEHRLERLKSKQVIFNDAKSTNALSLETAVKAVYESYGKHVLIMGGKKRHAQDFPDHRILDLLKRNCSKVLCIGESAQGLESLDHDLFTDVKDILGALEKVSSKDTLLFSPGYPSFDQFKNYIDRGECFKQAIGVLS